MATREIERHVGGNQSSFDGECFTPFVRLFTLLPSVQEAQKISFCSDAFYFQIF